MKTHAYTPIHYTPTAPRPDIDAVQRALLMLPDEAVISLIDTVRSITPRRAADDSRVVYRRKHRRMQNQIRRSVRVKIDPGVSSPTSLQILAGDVPVVSVEVTDDDRIYMDAGDDAHGTQ